MKSSSESIAMDPVVSGVGGAASGPAEASLFGRELLVEIVASAAFRLRVVGGILVTRRDCSSGVVTSKLKKEDGSRYSGQRSTGRPGVSDGSASSGAEVLGNAKDLGVTGGSYR